MLRRAKSVDIPFMVKGYEIGLRDGNFSQSAMQINAFFANTTTHKNVHSYIYENNGAPAGYAVLRKKDSAHHEIMMMFVAPDQQGNGIGKAFLQALLSGPMQELPVLCSTTQPASTRMMSLLRRAGFEQKIETSEGIYWEKANRSDAPTLPSKVDATLPTPKAGALTGGLPLTLPSLDLFTITDEPVEVLPPLPPQNLYHGENSAPLLDIVPDHDKNDDKEPPPPQQVTPTISEEPVADAAPTSAQSLEQVADQAADDDDSASPAATDTEVDEANLSAQLPKPPVDFDTPRPLTQRERGKRWAKSIFGARGTGEAEKSQPEPSKTLGPSLNTAQHTLETSSEMEDDLMLATLTTIREKLGALPNAKLPPLDRYQLDAFNKKDLENMNIVELAALSAQLIRLARDQLSEIDRLKISTKRTR